MSILNENYMPGLVRVADEYYVSSFLALNDTFTMMKGDEIKEELGKLVAPTIWRMENLIANRIGVPCEVTSKTIPDGIVFKVMELGDNDERFFLGNFVIRKK